MGKGMSPHRLFMRNAPRKTAADDIDGSCSDADCTGAAPQSRQPLGPIAENPLVTVAEQSSPATPRAKAKVSFPCQEAFPSLENSEVHATFVNTSPDETASSQSKGKFTWHHRHEYTAQRTMRDGPPLLDTPLGSICSEAQAANSQDTSHRGGRVPSTSESESGSSQSQNNVSESLRYGQQGRANNSGASGLKNVRSTVSQNVIARSQGYLHAAKGVIHQATNQNCSEHHFELEEDASFWRDHNVQVIIRTRPLSNSELSSQGSNRCLKQESPHAVSWLGQPESRFTFDHVVGEKITQAKLFDVAGLPMVENCMSGYNSCMFAYGQTGSGKTHTMLGDIENLDRRPSDNRGMTPRVFEYLFARIRTEEDCRRHEHLKFFCKCSFLEIYNEQITDLLEPSSTNLQMREDAKKGVYVENLSEVEVQCVQDVIQLLLQGAANRKVAATNMNRESSRSHSVFTCVVESKWESNSMTNSRYGRLHLVDLAGSERQKSSGAEGGRLKEAASINKSLSTLGLVIMILVDVANGKQRHVPYRDSKLTFLLQDSLGGNSKTIVIANVSSSSCCAMETFSTLKFAQRAKFIRNNAVINEDASGDVIALRQRIEELKVEVDHLRRENMWKVSSSREDGSVAGQKCGDKLDASTLNCEVIEGFTLESNNAHKSQTSSITNNDKHSRSNEAVLAGVLRREQQAEDVTQKLAAEMAQIVLERDNGEADKIKMKNESDAREAKLRKKIAAAELKLVSTERSLKLAVENVEALGLSMRALEEEIVQLKEDAKRSLSKVTEQQEQIDTLRGSMALKAECAGADDSIGSLNQLREQYILAESTWRSEQEILTKKLEELAVSARQINIEEVRKEGYGVSKSRGQLSQCLPEFIPGSEDQKHFEEAHRHDRQKQEIKELRAKISVKDSTILSAKKEMQIAIGNLKEAELEMDKVHRQNHRLTQVQLDNKRVIESLSLKIRIAEEELQKRDMKIEGCEVELQKVVGVMSDWETKMRDVEIEWRKEKEALARELTEAQLVANEKRTEAAALLQKFQDGQATLKEAEDLVDALVQANENAKHDALDWKIEKESLGIAQGWWMPERDSLVSKIAKLETDMHTQNQDIWIICKEAVDGSVETMDIVLAADEELSELKRDYQQDMDHLAVEMKILKGDLVAFLLDLEGEMVKTFELMQTVVSELISEKERALKDLADLKVLKEETVADSLQTTNSQLETGEKESDQYQTDLVVENEQLEMVQTMNNQLKAVEKERDEYQTDLVVLSEQLEMAQTMNSQLKAVEDERDKYQTDLVVLTEELEMAQKMNSQLKAVEKERDKYQTHLVVLTEELEMAQMMISQLKSVEQERDKLRTDLIVLNEQLEIAQTLANEREMAQTIADELEMAQTLVAEAHQAAERSKTHAEEKEEEARILERSVDELEKTVYALEGQLDIVKRESERQRVGKEAFETELETLKSQMALMQVTRDSQDAQPLRDLQGAETSKNERDRIVIEMRNQQMQARRSVESLQQECAEKDVQLRSCKAHIAELMLGAEKQASENQQKLKTLEVMVKHLKVEERKVYPACGSVSKAVEKSTAKVKGAGSPFKCIGSGLEKQRSSDMDEEVSAAKKRIKDLEAVAASRQKEVFMLNTKLAEAESMTHDVVRDLLGVKMDIASYATLLNQHQVQRIAERARRRTLEAQQKENELDTLRGRLNEFIVERESWLEEINRRQAEAAAARVSAEKLRLRDEILKAENDEFREDCHALRKKVADLEDEIKRLSRQQNLQQRIHHHAKIQEENNSIRLQNEDLSGKLRRMEILFTRVNDELARYRTAEGKSAFLNFDEEASLQKKLQETEESRLQLGETLIGLCAGIKQAAGIQRASRDLDPSAAMIALQQLQDRLESSEREISDYKLEARIAVEKRRLSDLRDILQ